PRALLRQNIEVDFGEEAQMLVRARPRRTHTRNQVPQLLAQRGVVTEDGPRPSPKVDGDGVDEVVLVLEVTVDRALGDAGVRRDLVQADCGNPMRPEELRRRGDQFASCAGPLAAGLRAACGVWAAALGGATRH